MLCSRRIQLYCLEFEKREKNTEEKRIFLSISFSLTLFEAVNIAHKPNIFPFEMLQDNFVSFVIIQTYKCTEQFYAYYRMK